MERNEFKFKKDQYRNSRGGYSKFINLYCDHCGEHILLYQKDGPGPLKRMYLDRIFAPKQLADWQNTKNVKDVPQLTCDRCHRLIAIPAIYEKEDRSALLLLSCSFIKKITKGIYPPIIKKVKTK